MSDLQEQTQLLRQVRLALQANDFSTAIMSLERVVQLAEIRQDWGAMARHMGNLALTYYRSGDTVKSIENFMKAITCARKDDDRLTENGLLGNVGNVLREIGHYEEAIKHLNQALLIAQEIGDMRGRGIWLSNLGLVYDDMRDPQTASDYHAQSVEIARSLHDQAQIASRLGNLGNSLMLSGEVAQALTCFKESATLFLSMGKKQEGALRLGILGNIYAQLGRNASPDKSAFGHFANALESYQHSVTIAHELQDYISEAELLQSMAGVLVEIGKYEDALAYLQACAWLFMRCNLPEKAQRASTMHQELERYLQK